MGVVERGGDLAREPEGLLHRELSVAAQARAQRFPGDEGHDVVEQAVGLARVDQAEDMGVLEVGGDLDLGEEAGAAEDGGELGVEDLDGDLAAVLGVLGEVDGGHAALAQLAHEMVAVGQGGLEPGDYFLHDIVSQKGASRCRERTALAT